MEHSMLDRLNEYLATTTKEQQQKDWDSLKEWADVGPSVSEFLGWTGEVKRY